MSSRRYTELGFDDTKTNIINFLSSKPEFKDYEFTGSNLNILIDALAYVTTYIGAYSNMSVSEIFMQSAQLRNSVVSRAKTLSYMPRQINSAEAIVSMSVKKPIGYTGDSLIVPRGTRYTSSLNNKSYNFVVTDDSRMVDTNGDDKMVNEKVSIRQGSLQSQDWVYDPSSKERFILTQPNVDVDFLKVHIQDSIASSNVESWALYDEITSITRETPAYFMQETEDNRVEIYFGDGVVGKKLEAGNVIKVEYLVTKGEEANLCNKFELVSDVKGINRNLFTITTAERAGSGAAPESVESIKLNAPNAFAAQKRAVTPTDYETLLSTKYGAIQTMNIWGGEDNVPPQYGKVFACIKPTYGLELSPAVKKRLTDEILRKYGVVGIVPTMVDADYTYVNMKSILDVNMANTTMIEGQLVSAVTKEIGRYFNDSLNKFNTAFKYSNISTRIDNVSDAVLSSTTSITLSKKFIPVPERAQTYAFSYNNAILPSTVECVKYSADDGATYSVIRDDGKGGLLYFYRGVLVKKIGTVDYETGNLSLVTFAFITKANTTIEFKATPKASDIQSIRNNLVIAGNIDVTIPEHIVTQ